MAMDSSASHWLARCPKTFKRPSRVPFGSTLNPQGGLCQRCATVDWPRHTSKHAALCESKGYRFFVRQQDEELLESSCPTCHIWVHGESNDRNTISEHKDSMRELVLGCICLVAESPMRSTGDPDCETHPLASAIQHTPLLRMCKSVGGLGYTENIWSVTKFYDASSSLATRIVDPNNVDYGVIRNWLESCNHRHSQSCGAIGYHNIPGFKVIDCETMQVIPALQISDFKYVILSYVWGSTRKSEPDHDHIPHTIQDAITVTLAIGHRYLWVDQIVCYLDPSLVFLD